MSQRVKTDPQTELVDAARAFLLDVYGKAPKEAMCGMTPDGLFQALYSMSPSAAARNAKANPDGAPSIRLVQAIKRAERAKP
ncbi:MULTISPECIES: hypothetical protein [Thalassospira]|jgi:hypothetical protein|uniref:hypothetical protein n=1 Tax=Thalassospira TaxID=168934 RepID=UPI0008DE1DFB|nr:MULTISPECIES: hypothetical protein [Thalassospira]MBL4839362.1 hypothetical protein [Thalassospira sp.]MDM7975202.1 hypothetical protein [Thalassospira xiamenensis]OHZ01012.1 hypothetical protein BC440_09245 [Thalassospira sp. MIT1004]PXX36246.1 hypothetical protein C7967_101639 [Thalassospira sp. 11-3]QPL37451.1 hypothetical protein IT971_09260 [Thalassospira sp. B30-1]